MKSLKKISDLSDKFEIKLKSFGQNAPIVSQEGTTELFFDNASNQAKFSVAAQDAVKNILMNYWNKNEKPSSFDMKINAVAGKGAGIILNVTPPMLKGSVLSVLDKVFKNIVGMSIVEKQRIADKKAKSGGGSGTLNVASLEIGD